MALVGGELAAGFWKSFVQVEKSKRWIWQNESADELAALAVGRALMRATSIEILLKGRPNGNALEICDRIEQGRPVGEVTTDDIGYLIPIVKYPAAKVPHATEVSLSVSVGGKEFHYDLWCFSISDSLKIAQEVDSWIEPRRGIIAALTRTMTVECKHARRIKLPTHLQMQTLAHAAGPLLPRREFGPTAFDLAYDALKKGDLKTAIATFREAYTLTEDSYMANDLGYSLVLDKQYKEALAIFEKAPTKLDGLTDSLWLHNRGIAKALVGDIEGGINTLKSALALLASQQDREERGVVCMLILDKDHKSAQSIEEIPGDAAAMINLQILGAVTRETTIELLAASYGAGHLSWTHLLK